MKIISIVNIKCSKLYKYKKRIYIFSMKNYWILKGRKGAIFFVHQENEILESHPNTGWPKELN